MSGVIWKNVWRILEERHVWRRRLERLSDDDFWGAGEYASKEEAEARGRRDAAYFGDELEMDIVYLGARPFPSPSVEDGGPDMGRDDGR